MSAARASMTALRFARVELAIALAYAVARLALGALSADGGLLTPGGAVRPGVLAIGAIALVLRLVVLFIVPAVLAYRVLARAGSLYSSRR